MIPYTEFKDYMLGLIDLVLSKPDDRIDLSTWTEMGDAEVEIAQETHVCGSAACLGGYLPEYDPDRFGWDIMGYPRVRKPKDTRPFTDSDFLATITDSGGYHNVLNSIFNPNLSETYDDVRVEGDPDPDRTVIERRRKAIADAGDYAELESVIAANVDREF